MIEIRDYGDHQTLVLYTNENGIYHKLAKSAKCIKEIPYYQQQNRILKMVGVDLYFPRKYQAWLFAKTGVTNLSN